MVLVVKMEVSTTVRPAVGPTMTLMARCEDLDGGEREAREDHRYVQRRDG